MSDAPGNRAHTSQTCAFCKIIRGEETASIVFEDSLSLAFLDHRPLFPGHCLLVPRAHSVPHVHIHLVPRRRTDGLKGFFWPRQRYLDDAAMREVQDTLREVLARLQFRL